VFMSLPEYLELLDWTDRQIKPGKRGSMEARAPPILDRLNLSPELWLVDLASLLPSRRWTAGCTVRPAKHRSLPARELTHDAAKGIAAALVRQTIPPESVAESSLRSGRVR